MAINEKMTTVGDGTLTLTLASSPIDFSGQVTAGTIKPSIKEGDPITFLNGDKSGGIPTYSYSVDVDFCQNLTESGLAGFLWKNRGKTATIKYVPSTADGFSFSGQVRLDPPETGGEVTTSPIKGHSFKVVGEPEVVLAKKAGGKA